MSDFKSKLPDFQELTSMTSKLFKGIKKSVDEIIQDYKEKRAQPEEKHTPAEHPKKAKSEETKKSEASAHKEKAEPTHKDSDKK